MRVGLLPTEGVAAARSLCYRHCAGDRRNYYPPASDRCIMSFSASTSPGRFPARGATVALVRRSHCTFFTNEDASSAQVGRGFHRQPARWSQTHDFNARAPQCPRSGDRRICCMNRFSPLPLVFPLVILVSLLCRGRKPVVDIGIRRIIICMSHWSCLSGCATAFGAMSGISVELEEAAVSLRPRRCAQSGMSSFR
jgi:hypothetical protein